MCPIEKLVRKTLTKPQYCSLSVELMQIYYSFSNFFLLLKNLTNETIVATEAIILGKISYIPNIIKLTISIIIMFWVQKIHTSKIFDRILPPSYLSTMQFRTPSSKYIPRLLTLRQQKISSSAVSGKVIIEENTNTIIMECTMFMRVQIVKAMFPNLKASRLSSPLRSPDPMDSSFFYFPMLYKSSTASLLIEFS